MSRSKGKRSHKTNRKKTKHRQRRFRGRNYHHLTPKARGGNREPSNLLLMGIEKHRCWHQIFGLLNLREVIQLLERLDKKKRSQK